MDESIKFGDRHPRSAHLLRLPRRPAEVPETRGRFVEWTDLNGGMDVLVPAGTDPGEAQLDMMSKGLLPALTSHATDATCYWVTADMTELLAAAMPSFPLEATCPPLPDEAGFLLFEAPVRLWPGMSPLIRGFFWAEQVAIMLTSFEPESGPVEMYAEGVTALIALAGHDDEARRTWPSSTLDAWRLIATCTTMMQQRIAVIGSVPMDRASRRRAARLGNETTETRIVDLRRPADRDRASAPAGPANWSHRWIVGGHWRNHWMPRSQTHQPMWIAPHVKGPDDKPIVIHDRVYRWSR